MRRLVNLDGSMMYMWILSQDHHHTDKGVTVGRQKKDTRAEYGFGDTRCHVDNLEDHADTKLSNF